MLKTEIKFMIQLNFGNDIIGDYQSMILQPNNVYLIPNSSGLSHMEYRILMIHNPNLTRGQVYNLSKSKMGDQ